MKLVFFLFKHRYRKKELNNFLATRIYGKYFILNLGGPFKHFVAKILIFLKMGKAISCDGRPTVSDKSKGINFWLRGTTLNIPSDLKKLNNNFVHIFNPLFEENKVFQIYPIKIKKAQIQSDLKIIYISRVNIETSFEEKIIWDKYKNKLIENFSLIDNKDFWEKIFQKDSDKYKNFNLYKKIKLLLRFEIIKNLKKIFSKKLILVGDDWKSLSFDTHPSNYYMKQINKLYNGNICLDLGSIEGSMSLYSRPNRIIESGGLIIQSIQWDSKEIWKNLHNKILFNNIPELISLIEKLLNNRKYCSALLQKISENFRYSEKSIEKSLDKIFNILN